MATVWRFYVYEVLNDLGSVIYVGKGSGLRKNASRRARGGSSVREVARFKREVDAYSFEREHIAALKPSANKHPGGNGSMATPEREPRQDKFDALLQRIGTRACAARLVLFHAARLGIPIPKVDEIRRVAHG